MKKLIVLFLLGVAPASAHDYWGSGAEIDAKTKALCCGKNDCKQVDEADVEIRGDGLVHFHDTTLTIPVGRIMPSPDGLVWRCIWGGEIKCFFMPAQSM